jgi:3'-phosphoadenosine 5'-phosphosulfate sulfotransferase (PAPS reductase)/FAD synthetase
VHVVALSGGKDSTAMALRLAEVEPREYVYVITPTGDELPAMFAHWRRCAELLGRPLTPITSGYSLTSLIEHYGALPNWRQRWCTRVLKLEPFRTYLLAHRPAVSYVGLRADEEAREGAVYGAVDDVTSRFPLREWGWGLAEVRAYLAARGVEIPPRTDCARCFFQRLGEWWALWHEHPEAYADAERQEIAVGHTFRSPGRDTWPAGLAQLRLQFEAGRVPRGVSPSGAPVPQCRACSL